MGGVGLLGVVGVILPAFGYFPALGSEQFNVQAFHAFFAQPSNLKMIQLSFTTGVMATVIAVTGTFVILAFLYNTTLLSRVQRLISPLLVLPHAGIAIALLCCSAATVQDGSAGAGPEQH